ncbi:hypothetical protein ACHAQA_005942 [Verticillium albo-atrum]
MACGLGYCPTTVCAAKPKDYVCPVIPVKAPPVPKCVAGTADGPYKALCDYNCKYNECPPDLCMCTKVAFEGPAVPVKTALTATPLSGKDYGLCNWACSHGFCDDTVCKPLLPVALPVESLNKESTCRDQENYRKTVDTSFWKDVKAGEVLDEWFKKNPNSGNWYFDFASPLGVGQSSICTIGNNRAMPNCASLQATSQVAAQSAAKLQILMSMINLHKYLIVMSKAVLEAKVKFASLEAWILVTYLKGPNPVDDNMKQWFNGINTGINVAAAAGGPAGAPLGPLVGGVLNAVQIGMEKPIEFTDLAAFELAAQDLVNSTTVKLEDAHVNLFGRGKWGDAEIQSVLADGAFLDYRTIPVLNTDQNMGPAAIVSQTDLAELLYQPMLGTIINTAWRRQGLILMAYPMTRAEFDVIEILGDDFGLRYWDPPNSGDVGVGYFYQSWEFAPNQGYGATDMVVHVWPLGYKELNASKIGWEDPFVSSIEAHKKGGFNYKPVSEGLFSGTTRSRTKLDRPSKDAGIFNIPICQIPKEKAKDYKAFAKLLSGRGDSFGLKSNMMMTEWPGYCECEDLIGPENGGKLTRFKDISLEKGTWDICSLGKLG